MKITHFLLLIGTWLTVQPLQAQELVSANVNPNLESPPFNYTVGVRLKSNDISSWSHAARVRPVLGFTYGKWRVGMGDGEQWQTVGQIGTEPSLSYQILDTNKLKLGLSLRVHNVDTGENFDVFENGTKTLRSRMMVSQQINRNLSFGLDWTQDLLNKGDSTTLSFGVAYSWPVFKQSEIILSAGTTWATADHWRGSEFLNSDPIDFYKYKTGFEKINSGISFKQSLSKKWAWYASLGISQNFGNLKTHQGKQEITSGQVGILYFQRQ